MAEIILMTGALLCMTVAFVLLVRTIMRLKTLQAAEKEMTCDRYDVSNEHHDIVVNKMTRKVEEDISFTSAYLTEKSRHS